MLTYIINAEPEVDMYAIRDSIENMVNISILVLVTLTVMGGVLFIGSRMVNETKASVNKINNDYRRFYIRKTIPVHYGRRDLNLSFIELIPLTKLEGLLTKKKFLVEKDGKKHIRLVRDYAIPIEFKDEVDDKLVPILSYIKSKPDLMLPHFYTNIDYSLKTLSNLGRFKDTIDYSKEIDRVADTLSNIKKYVEDMDYSVTKTISEQKKEAIEEYLKKHELAMEEVNRGIDILRGDKIETKR